MVFQEHSTVYQQIRTTFQPPQCILTSAEGKKGRLYKAGWRDPQACALSLHGAVMSNVLANCSLFTRSADTEQH